MISREEYLAHIDTCKAVMQETKNPEIAKQASDLIVSIGQQIGNAEYISSAFAKLGQAVADLEIAHTETQSKISQDIPAAQV